MSDILITVHEYSGPLGISDLIGSNAVPARHFGPALTGTVDAPHADGNGWQPARFEGRPVTGLCSGKAMPCIMGGDLLPAIPVILFSSRGRIYATFPEGPPDFSSLAALDMALSTDPADMPVPAGFASGTLIKVPGGHIPVEHLMPGDPVVGHDGRIHTICWTGARRTTIPFALHTAFGKWHPVCIPASSFGPGVPFADLLVSQELRVLLEGHEVEEMTGEWRAFTGAGGLTGTRIRVDGSFGAVTYHHILCDTHALLVANGLPCESLFTMGADTADAYGAGPGAGHGYAAVDEMRTVAPCLSNEEAHAVMRRIEGRKLRERAARRATIARGGRTPVRRTRPARSNVTPMPRPVSLAKS